MPTVAGHQTNHLPYGGYFAKMNSVDTFILVDDTQYVKKEFHNRNRVLLLTGKANWLSIPVNTAGKFYQKINEVEIDNRSKWSAKHLKTIELNYRNCLYFKEIFPELEQIYNQQWSLLADFNIEIIEFCKLYLGIQTPLMRSSKLGSKGKATELIADICHKTSSDTYLHGKHSRDYVDFSLLEKHNIKSEIQDFTCISYHQPVESFVPNLAAIDLMFNCGPKSLEILMDGNSISEFN